ncbi:MAG: TlpA family protein disulfide reductase [Bacteroidales bacterium]|nr:TlpA family protein disulfide reductase [Bacteroidales bacterium]
MKKIFFPVTSFFIVLSCVILINSCKVIHDKNDYLRKVLANLEQIRSASYNSTNIASAPGDTLEFRTFHSQTEEYFNYLDTFIGSSFGVSMQSGTSSVRWFYDGKAEAFLDLNDKTIMIDSFQTNTLPFRPITPPFFNHAKSMIKYALETKDTITTELRDYNDSIKFSLYIPYKVVEFFGKPFVLDNPYLAKKDSYSRYDIWIRKSDDLPYRIRRNMPHQTTWETCENVEFNKINIGDFIVSKKLPADFTVRFRGEPEPAKEDLVGKVAPDWVLKDFNQDSISLKKIKSKVLMVQFSGIGCGPCHASIPFLNQLVADYRLKDFDLVSIETWSNNIDGIKRYFDNNNLNYKLLLSTEQITKEYQVKAVPAFFILDKDRVIRKIIVGYDKETTDKEIRDALNKLI